MKPEGAIDIYLQKVASGLATGHAREHAHRPAFQELIQSFEKELQIVNDPKRSEYGAPDFIFLRKDLTVGYAETKDVGVSLDKTEKSEQMARYLGYSNLILSDYLEFRFFRNGERYAEPIMIAEMKNGTLLMKPENFRLLSDTIADFLKAAPENIRSGTRLAKIMGGKARRIRENVAKFIEDESERGSELRAIYAIIKKLLVHDLSAEAFADMYAQTLVYGLFVARYHDETPENFTRQEARDLVPPSNPFLQHFFDHIVGPNFDKRLSYIVDELCAVFSVADVKKLMGDYFKLGEKEKDAPDPVIHFYEDFLKEYDPAQRLKLGAFYTPLPVVRFIVRAIDDILIRDFGLTEGLADTSKIERDVVMQGRKGKESLHRVQFLDPAVGTGTFLNEVVKEIAEKFKGQEGRWKSYVDAELLPRLHGFELMMAPYTIAHLKLAMTLRDSGYEKFSRRLGIYLTNSLEEAHEDDNSLFGPGVTGSIAQEALDASDIKNNKPIMVVMGNPPYSGVSSNNGEFAQNLVARYKVEPGGLNKLKERNSKWINDDYVKFIAFAESMIEKNGDGILGFITNNGYIDNPTFRGMRWHLAKTFDKIYIVDLHGNAKKKETDASGGKDENVFDIQQGVGILLAVKTGQKKKGELAQVFHEELLGMRSRKFDTLSNHAVSWREVVLDATTMAFLPEENPELKTNYKKFISVRELFHENVLGFQTHRDEFAICDSREEVVRRLDVLLSDVDDKFISEKHKVNNNRDWNLKEARIRLRTQSEKERSNLNSTCSYRPFDTKWTYLDEVFSDYPRTTFKKHLLNRENYVLGIGRQGLAVGGIEWCLVFVSKDAIDANMFRRGGINAFPLYLYADDGSKVSNLDTKIVEKITKRFKENVLPEDILDYVYAVLHSPSYRERYKEFLKIDFPRVPYPKDEATFWKLVDRGRELRKLHLMESPILAKLITTFPEAGENVVEKISYSNGKVFINKTQYFGSVPEVAWSFYIGGYQPAQKWLKDRKGRALTNDDLVHYQKIIVVLVETDRIMKEIGGIDFL